MQDDKYIRTAFRPAGKRMMALPDPARQAGITQGEMYGLQDRAAYSPYGDGE